jgi:hypothetical protein
MDGVSPVDARKFRSGPASCTDDQAIASKTQSGRCRLKSILRRHHVNNCFQMIFAQRCGPESGTIVVASEPGQAIKGRMKPQRDPSAGPQPSAGRHVQARRSPAGSRA